MYMHLRALSYALNQPLEFAMRFRVYVSTTVLLHKNADARFTIKMYESTNSVLDVKTPSLEEVLKMAYNSAQVDWFRVSSRFETKLSMYALLRCVAAQPWEHDSDCWLSFQLSLSLGCGKRFPCVEEMEGMG